MFAAIRRASSRVSNLAAARVPARPRVDITLPAASAAPKGKPRRPSVGFPSGPSGLIFTRRGVGQSCNILASQVTTAAAVGDMTLVFGKPASCLSRWVLYGASDGGRRQHDRRNSLWVLRPPWFYPGIDPATT